MSSNTMLPMEDVVPLQQRSAKKPHRRHPPAPEGQVFSLMPNGSVLERYCRRKSRDRDVPDAMTDKCLGGYSGSWTPAPRGGTYQRRNSDPIAQLTVGTASGARKDSGLG